MDALYHQTNNLIQQTQQRFQQLEGNAKNVEEIENDIENKIQEINRYVLLKIKNLIAFC